MAARNFLPRCVACELRIYDDSIRSRVKNTMHFGKKFLAAMFGVIVYLRQTLVKVTGAIIDELFTTIKS